MKNAVYLLCLLFPLMSLSNTLDTERASFIYKIAKFIEFPNQVNKSSIRICFTEITNGPGFVLYHSKPLLINRKPVEVKEVEFDEDFIKLSSQCDIAYISEENEKDALTFLLDKAPLNVLIIGESINFIKSLGVASLVKEGSKTQLYFNKRAMMQHNFKVLTRLLVVSKFYPD